MNLARVLHSSILIGGLLVAAPLGAQPIVPAAGLAAEGERRWDDAVAIYRDALAREPRRADLCVRIADIEAAQGHLDAAIEALHQAARLSEDPSIYERLSRAYSAANQPRSALEAIEGALALSPENADYLSARATLATWTGEYGRAQDSYRQLARLLPDDPAFALGLARVSSWSGDGNEACSMYRAYLEQHPEDAAVWLELATAERLRGNYAAGLDALASYREQVGITPAYSAELAALLARAGRPTEAVKLVEPLIRQQPDNQSLHVTRTMAEAMRLRTREAFAGVDSLRERWPSTADTETTRRLVRANLGSTVVPELSVYNDSDGLHVLTFDPRASVVFSSGSTLGFGYRWNELTAPAGSGLELPDGQLTAHHREFLISGSQRLGALAVRAQGGQATVDSSERWNYGLGFDIRAHDTLSFGVERSTGFLTISPRTVGLGITRLDHAAQVDWTPSIRYSIAADGRQQRLSDGNSRWELTVSSRRVVTRTQHLNLDLGASMSWLGVARNLDNGYYDPELYEYYAGVVNPYWKISEDFGLSGAVALGVQRDLRPGSFQFGGNATVTATFGIYDPWLLRIIGNATNNRRLGSGAFQGFSASIGLTRVF
jgi:tetratricopeptide (TPR) repeat protein